MALIRKAELARRAGVTPATVTKACKGWLADAVKDGWIDTEHPSIPLFIAGERPSGRPNKNRGVRKGSKKPPKRTKKVPQRAPPPEPPPDGSVEDPLAAAAMMAAGESSLVDELTTTLSAAGVPASELAELPDKSLRWVSQRYRSMTAVHLAVKIMKDHALWQDKEAIHLARRGELIKRELVAATLMPLVDIAFRRIVSEMPETVTEQTIAIVRGKDDAEASIEIQELLRKVCSRILRECKMNVQEGLRADLSDEDE